MDCSCRRRSPVLCPRRSGRCRRGNRCCICCRICRLRRQAGHSVRQGKPYRNHRNVQHRSWCPRSSCHTKRALPSSSPCCTRTEAQHPWSLRCVRTQVQSQDTSHRKLHKWPLARAWSRSHRRDRSCSACDRARRKFAERRTLRRRSWSVRSRWATPYSRDHKCHSCARHSVHTRRHTRGHRKVACQTDIRRARRSGSCTSLLLHRFVQSSTAQLCSARSRAPFAWNSAARRRRNLRFARLRLARSSQPFRPSLQFHSRPRPRPPLLSQRRLSRGQLKVWRRPEARRFSSLRHRRRHQLLVHRPFRSSVASWQRSARKHLC